MRPRVRPLLLVLGFMIGLGSVLWVQQYAPFVAAGVAIVLGFVLPSLIPRRRRPGPATAPPPPVPAPAVPYPPVYPGYPPPGYQQSAPGYQPYPPASQPPPPPAGPPKGPERLG